MPRSPHRIRVAAFVTLLLCSLASAAHAQTPVDDFNPGANSSVEAIALQPDGKIVVAGRFTMLGGGGSGMTPRNYIGRLNADGSVDTSFNPGANGFVWALAIQPDGKILVGGQFTGLGGGTGTTPRNHIGRLNADGSIDSSFNPGANRPVLTLALQPDGKIVVGGGFTGLGGGTGATPRRGLGRLNADGSVDAGFSPVVDGFDYVVFDVTLQPDEKILVGGNFFMLAGAVRIALGRLNTDGTIDTGFNPPPIDNGQTPLFEPLVSAFAVQLDGKILIGGAFKHIGGVDNAGFARLNSDGSIDSTFDLLTGGGIGAMAMQSDGKIVIGGWFAAVYNGSHWMPRTPLVRLTADGSFDYSFNPGTNGHVSALAVQPDGSILVGGDFTTLGGGGTGSTTRHRIGRLDERDRLIVGLGPSASGGWAATRQGFNGSAPSTWMRLPWPDYNAAGGGVRVAAGDVDGDGLDEVIAGVGSGGAGWIAVFDDAVHGYAFMKWIQVTWPEYNRANGEVWPAVGDLDGDGRAEIVAGLGIGGAGWFEIFDDAAADFVHVAWRRVAWSHYNMIRGVTHPAVGNVDGVGASEIVVGLGNGAEGWIEVFNDAAGDYSHHSWVRVNWQAYNAANGTTFPAVGDLDGDGRAEIVAGLGHGGGGWLEVFEDGSSGFSHAAWLRSSWSDYNVWSSGETHPAVGNLDGDGAAEIVIGFDFFPAHGGWFEILDDGEAGYASRGFRNLDWEYFKMSGGGTYPAIGRFR